MGAMVVFGLSIAGTIACGIALALIFRRQARMRSAVRERGEAITIRYGWRIAAVVAGAVLIVAGFALRH
jgi:hypothetical protein